MSVAIEGTPQVIVEGGSYTAETTGSDRAVVFVIHAVYSVNFDIGTPTMGSQNCTEAIQDGSTDKVASGIFYIKDADIPTGSQVVSGNFAITPDGSQITCFTLSGVDQTIPVFDTATLYAGSGNTETVSGLTSAANGISIAGGNWRSGDATFNTDPVSDGYTQVAEGELAGTGPSASHYKSTDGTDESFTYTELNGIHAVVGATFQPTTSGGFQAAWARNANSIIGTTT